MAGWANYPTLEAEVFEPADQASAREILNARAKVLARGNGKSYGDAALGPVLLSTLRWNNILHFDAENGIVHCESGVLLRQLMPLIIPSGWFFRVTPGIKDITVGGAIASDVHGKNHPVEGCFSNSLISFELMRANGEVVTCSREENADLFWQSCGGMGWTGLILSAKFRLMCISSTSMWQRTVRSGNLEALFQAFDANRDWPYAAAWVDCTDKNRRGAAYFARHEENPGAEMPVYEEPKSKNIPFFAPSWFLNPLSIKAHNHFYNKKSENGERSVSLEKYFYPLDSLQNWNRFYGKRGFVQYQFCLPEENAFDGMRKALDTIAKSPETPFLTVLKRHGERPPEALNYFPIKGYSLALDFPRTKGIFKLVKQLDELVWANGGKIYLTKDACSDPKMGRVDPAAFGENKFGSLLRDRLLWKKS